MKQLKIDVLPLINKLEAVLKKGFSRELMAGNYQSVYKGKGLEFVGFREYVPNDDALLIDWKASLRANKLLVRQLQEERDLTVFFLIDISDSMLLSSHSKLKCEYTAELVATLCFAMHSVGDSVGIGLFNDKIIKVIPPSIGRAQFYNILRVLSNPSFYGGKFSLGSALKFLLSIPFLKRDSIVFVVSDFIGMESGWEHQIRLAGLKYDITAIVVRDPIDMKLPMEGGEVSLGDPYSGKRILVNPLDTAQKYQMEAKNQIDRLKDELNKTKSSMLSLQSNVEFTQEVFNFFRIRKKYK